MFSISLSKVLRHEIRMEVGGIISCFNGLLEVVILYNSNERVHDRLKLADHGVRDPALIRLRLFRQGAKSVRRLQFA